jgi:hypothetical protein
MPGRLCMTRRLKKSQHIIIDSAGMGLVVPCPACGANLNIVLKTMPALGFEL